MTNGQLRSARQIIRDWVPNDVREEFTRADFSAAFSADAAPLRREQGATHATASCFVFDSRLRCILLVLHRKGRFWVQPGGHLEAGDPSIPAAAYRELEEETGIRDLQERDVIAFDIDHHQLIRGFGRCGSHLDFGIAVIVDPSATLTISTESCDARWWPVGNLPTDSAPGLQARVRSLLMRVGRQSDI